MLACLDVGSSSLRRSLNKLDCRKQRSNHQIPVTNEFSGAWKVTEAVTASTARLETLTELSEAMPIDEVFARQVLRHVAS